MREWNERTDEPQNYIAHSHAFGLSCAVWHWAAERRLRAIANCCLQTTFKNKMWNGVFLPIHQCWRQPFKCELIWSVRLQLHSLCALCTMQLKHNNYLQFLFAEEIILVLRNIFTFFQTHLNAFRIFAFAVVVAVVVMICARAHTRLSTLKSLDLIHK